MRVLIAWALLPLAACTATAEYTPPRTDDLAGEFAAVLDQPFDVTWDNLIEHIGQTYFQIELVERESGLITLSFGSNQPEVFVTGGSWTVTSPSKTLFEGDYVEYLRRNLNAQFSANMNIVVRPQSEAKTLVTIAARYVVVANQVLGTGQSFTNTWVFESGGYDTEPVANPAPGIPPTRTLRPTHRAEQDLLDAIRQ